MNDGVPVREPHSDQMAKTWIPKGNIKSQQAFEKAMRAMLSPKGRRNLTNRPR
jgi:hypothetical protein